MNDSNSHNIRHKSYVVPATWQTSAQPLTSRSTFILMTFPRVGHIIIPALQICERRPIRLKYLFQGHAQPVGGGATEEST